MVGFLTFVWNVSWQIFLVGIAFAAIKYHRDVFRIIVLGFQALGKFIQNRLVSYLREPEKPNDGPEVTIK